MGGRADAGFSEAAGVGDPGWRLVRRCRGSGADHAGRCGDRGHHDDDRFGLPGSAGGGLAAGRRLCGGLAGAVRHDRRLGRPGPALSGRRRRGRAAPAGQRPEQRLLPAVPGGGGRRRGRLRDRLAEQRGERRCPRHLRPALHQRRPARGGGLPGQQPERQRRPGAGGGDGAGRPVLRGMAERRRGRQQLGRARPALRGRRRRGERRGRDQPDDRRGAALAGGGLPAALGGRGGGALRGGLAERGPGRRRQRCLGDRRPRLRWRRQRAVGRVGDQRTGDRRPRPAANRERSVRQFRGGVGEPDRRWQRGAHPAVQRRRHGAVGTAGGRRLADRPPARPGGGDQCAGRVRGGVGQPEPGRQRRRGPRPAVQRPRAAAGRQGAAQHDRGGRPVAGRRRAERRWQPADGLAEPDAGRGRGGDHRSGGDAAGARVLQRLPLPHGRYPQRRRSVWRPGPGERQGAQLPAAGLGLRRAGDRQGAVDQRHGGGAGGRRRAGGLSGRRGSAADQLHQLRRRRGHRQQRGAGPVAQRRRQPQRAGGPEPRRHGPLPDRRQRILPVSGSLGGTRQRGRRRQCWMGGRRPIARSGVGQAWRAGLAWWVLMAAGAAWLGSGAALLAQGAVCQGSNITYGAGGNDGLNPAQCSGFVCQTPMVTSGPTYAVDPGCNPTTTTCGITVTIGMQFPGNHVNSTFFNFGYSFEEVDLLTSANSLLGECGYAGEELQADFGTVTVTGSVRCGTPSSYTVNLISCPSANCPSCPPGPVPAFCTKTTPVPLDLTGNAGCPAPPAPPPDFCSGGGGAGGSPGGAGGAGGSGERMAGAGSKGNGPDSGAAGTAGGGGGGGGCQLCKSLGSSAGDGGGGGGEAAGGASGCGFSLGGGGASCAFKASGAHLRYGGGGVGGPGFPGSTGVTANPWNASLGRYWSHDYAERIVMDPDETHVWLLTRFGSFREFGSLAAGSGLRLYQTVTPSDEYRKLFFNATTQGWQLQGLDGSVELFLPKTAGSPAGMLAGFLDKITDRLYDPNNPTAHPPVQASYNAGNQLDHVTFPDGRRENSAYAGGTTGKLAALTEVGTDGVTARTWTFSWNGDDLIAIGRPDICAGLSVGTSWTLLYGDATHPGYVTQVMLMDCHNNGRVEAAFVYDVSGNVVEAWRGDPFFTGPNATDAFQLSFDSPPSPAVTTVQTLIKRVVVNGVNQDIWQAGTYNLDRDPGRAGARATRKARVRQVTGECPSCGTVANPAFTYGDANNPLLATVVTDGNGVATSFTYDANGRQLTKIGRAHV